MCPPDCEKVTDDIEQTRNREASSSTDNEPLSSSGNMDEAGDEAGTTSRAKKGVVIKEPVPEKRMVVWDIGKTKAPAGKRKPQTGKDKAKASAEGKAKASAGKGRGKEKEKEKERGKSRFEKGLLSTHMTICNLSDVFAKFNEDQIQAINEIGFGSILHLGLKTLDLRLGFWLVSNFDWADLTLKVGEGKNIKIDEDDVYSCLALPKGKRTVMEMNYQDCSSEFQSFVKDWKLSWECKGNIPKLTHMAEKISSFSGDAFKRNFVCFFISNLISGNHTGYCNLKVLFNLRNVSEISAFNWCGYTLDKLGDSVRIWKESTSGDKFFTGPLLLLNLIYLDRFKLGTHTVKRVFPIIKGWEQNSYLARLSLEKAAGKYGYGAKQKKFVPPARKAEVDHADADVGSCSMQKNVVNEIHEVTKEATRVFNRLCSLHTLAGNLGVVKEVINKSAGLFAVLGTPENVNAIPTQKEFEKDEEEIFWNLQEVVKSLEDLDTTRYDFMRKHSIHDIVPPSFNLFSQDDTMMSGQGLNEGREKHAAETSKKGVEAGRVEKDVAETSRKGTETSEVENDVAETDGVEKVVDETGGIEKAVAETSEKGGGVENVVAETSKEGVEMGGVELVQPGLDVLEEEDGGTPLDEIILEEQVEGNVEEMELVDQAGVDSLAQRRTTRASKRPLVESSPKKPTRDSKKARANSSPKKTLVSIPKKASRMSSRTTKPSSLLKSPYRIWAVDSKMNFSAFETKVISFVLEDNEILSVVYDDSFNSINQFEFKSMAPNEFVNRKVIDSFVHIINCDGKKRITGLDRLFFSSLVARSCFDGTAVTDNEDMNHSCHQMLIQTTRYGIIDCNTSKKIDMFIFPFCGDERYFLIVVNFKTSKIEVLDSRPISSEDALEHSKDVHFLISLFQKFLFACKDPRHNTIDKMEYVHWCALLKHDIDPCDAGIYLMRLIETYNGEGPKWDFDFKVSKKNAKDSLNVLRMMYVRKIALDDRNTKRDDITKTVKASFH